MEYELQPLLDHDYVELERDKNVYEMPIDPPPRPTDHIQLITPNKKTMKQRLLPIKKKYDVVNGKLLKNTKIIRIIVVCTLILLISSIIISNYTYTKDVAFYKNLGENKNKDDSDSDSDTTMTDKTMGWVLSIATLAAYLFMEIAVIQ